MKPILLVAALLAIVVRPALADPQSDIVNAVLAFGKLTSYHVTVTARGHEIDGDVVNPGKMHVTAGPAEIIVIGKTSYVKVGSSWHEFTIPGMDRMFAPLTYAQNLGTHRADIVVTDLGEKTVDGTLLHAYSVRTSADDKPATVYVDASGTMRRVEVSSTEGGLAVVTFSNFNAPVTIAPPI